MIQTYPDGSTIEIGYGGVYPPGHRERGGQDVTSSYLWLRKDGGEWRHGPSGRRSSHHARTLIEAAETADEAWEAMYAEEDAERAAMAKGGEG